MSVTKTQGPLYDPGLCRCCGNIKKCRILNVEYTHHGQKEIYSDLFVDCFGLLLSQLDGEPTERLICATCVTRLREANCFRLQVLQCEEKLLTTRVNGFDNDDQGKEIKCDTVIKEEVNILIEPEYDAEPMDDHHSDDEKPLITRKKRKLKKLRKRKREKLDVTDEMLAEMQRMSEKLEEMQYVEPAPQKPEKKSSEDIKAFANVITIVENSYVCPFDTSFSDYFCIYCRRVFTDPIKLREHTLTHDPNTFKEVLSNYTNNKKIQIDIDRIDCRLCPEVISDIDVFKRHVTLHGKEVHEAPNDFLKFKLTSGTLYCLECGNTFSFFHALKKHMAEHFGTCICDVCGAHYFEERMLVLHQKTHKPVDEVFNCKECGKNFKSKYTRYIHIARNHKKEAAYQCSKCDEVFFSYTLRYRHMIDYHGEERLFKCDQCDRTYDSRKSLREHNRRFHLKILKHECHLCDKRFYLPSRLKEHLASHTGERNFRCEFCGKSYPRLRGLKVHMQSHNSDKKFKCVMCNAAFTQNVNLKNHIKRQHQGLDVSEGYQECN
ncbi:zinc finger protein 26-like [Colias croceus]|uniref:zinc finger protein 26-like n=1 Tax=Colias crocea TaxID=72248 RepID=UPI001E27CEEC|nr:zinc finger protein 26-like [Colias croceus]